MSRNYLKTFLEKSLASKSYTLRVVAPTRTFIPNSTNVSKSSFQKYHSIYKNDVDFYKSYKPPSYTTNILPNKPSDIKGIDSSLCNPGIRFAQTSKYRPIVKNEFISIRFFPSDHFISQYRKSNVAFIYIVNQVATYNNSRLANEISKYKGKYKRDEFFQQNGSPLKTPFYRSRIRKLLRRLYVEIIQERNINKSQQVDMLAGTYLLGIPKLPVNTDQKQILKQGIEKAVDRILTDKKLWNEMQMNCRESYKLESKQLLREISFSNSFHASREPIRTVKFPFLSRQLPNKRQNRGSRW